MARKEGGAAVPLSRELGPRLIQCGLGRGLLPYQVASSSIQPFGHNRHGPKIGCGWVCAFFWGSWVPIEHKVAWAEAYLHAKWHHSPSKNPALWPQWTVAENWALCPFRGGGAGSPSNTMSRKPRSIAVPSGILMRPAVWPQ